MLLLLFGNVSSVGGGFGWLTGLWCILYVIYCTVLRCNIQFAGTCPMVSASRRRVQQSPIAATEVETHWCPRPARELHMMKYIRFLSPSI